MRVQNPGDRVSGRSTSLTGLYRVFQSVALLAGGLLLTALAPPAGTHIPSRASATYLSTPNGIRQTVQSNVVEIIILPQAALILTNNQEVARAPGASIGLPHRLTNVGNIPVTCTINVRNTSADDYDINSLSLVHDVNGNGAADPGEPVLPQDGTVSLHPEAFMDFVILGSVPGTIPADKRALIALTATRCSQDITVSNTDTIIVLGSPIIEIGKSASTLTPQRQEVVTFTLIGRNTGSAAATSTLLTVDGTAAAYVLIRDLMPANMAFVRLEPLTAGVPLYHQLGSPFHTYTSLPPADLTQVDAIAVGYPSFPPGYEAQVRFTATVNANASGTITNVGTILYTDGTEAKTKDSNPVELVVPLVAPTIAYYTNTQFTTQAYVLHLGNPLFVQADAAACNQSPTTIETRTLIITSALTGDVESFLATESAANSGLFRIVPPPPTMDATTHSAQPGNGHVETIANDALTARLEGCGATEVRTKILVDPFGVVFDSRTDERIAGAKVSFIDVTGQGNGGSAGGLARVLLEDTTTAAPNTLVTGPDGKFTFPLTASSTYRLVIEPPGDYSFPSTMPRAELPPGHVIEPAGSYGGTFLIGPTTGPVQLDIPLDRSGVGGLFVDKRASLKIVELGDFVDYTVKVQNTRDAAVHGVRLTDRLPAGFAMQRGTARLDKVKLPDPAGQQGPVLTFAIGTLPAQGSKTLIYRVRVGPSALQGDGINRASASSAPPLPQTSNVASAKVEVRGGVFSDQGFIVGKVFVDCNTNTLQDAAELGIPGVRLYLEDGTFAITDQEGKFSFAGITPRTHVLKLDKTTVPLGATFVALANRHAGDPHSRFVDLKNRDLHKADFAEGSCSPQVLDEVQDRRSKRSLFLSEEAKSLSTDLRPDDTTQTPRDPRTLPASGLVHQKDTIPHFDPVASQQPLDNRTSSLPARPVQPVPSVDLQQLLPTLDATLGFIDLKDGDTLPIAQTNVRLKGTADSTFGLTVNGTEVPQFRVGIKSKLPTTQVEAWEYIGVELSPGPNTLEVTQRDAFGNVRGRQAITLIAPDKLGHLKITVDQARPIADGRTPVDITVRLEDAHGVPVTVRTPVTLVSSLGQWQEPDLDPRTPGLQVFLTGGQSTLKLLPPSEAGDAVIRVSSGVLQAETLVPFFPDLRPLIAAGVVEGVINVNKLNPNALTPARKNDGFERELRALAFSANNGKVQGGARAALYLKGTLKGDYLLTLAYDSDKDTKERLFRDIQPDAFYPVYGDSSVHGFDAQSTGKLYVRVDKNKSYLLYGDFTSETRNPASNLGHYSRSLTGGKLHYENQRASINVFASRDNTRQVVDELPGRGVSGPYTLSTANILENSDKVEILTRDRNQPSLILETVPQTRFSDYEIDALGGTLLFKAPIPSLDSNLNPISIRIVYEVDQGGKDFWVYGVDGQVKITEFFQIGGSYAREDNPQERFEIASLNALVKLSDHSYMLAEVARTDRDRLGQGLGWRAELVHDGDKLKARVYIGRTEAHFDNPTALLGKGRFEAGAKATYEINERTKLIGEVVHTEDRSTTKGRRDGGQMAVAHSFGNGITGELGVRHSRETATPADRPEASATPYETTSVRARLGAQVPFLPQLNVFTEYEQDIVHTDRRIVAVGGEYQIFNHSRIYAKHELISSLRGPFTLNSLQKQHNTVVGVDVDYSQDGHVFSEYRLDNAIAGREAQAALGVRHRFYLSEGLTILPGFERVQTLEGKGQDSTALTGAIEYLASPRLKFTGRLELRASDSGDSLLQTLGVAYKISDDWTFLGKQVLSLTEQGAKERLRLGLAYRDSTTNVWHGLLRYEFKDDTEHGVRLAHILAATANYQPIQPLTLSGTVAAKWLKDHSNGYRSTSNTYLISSRATYDLTDKWDVGLTSSALFSGALSSVQYGLGLEVGRVITKNLWLSAGYNVFGFRDEDLAGADYTNPGFFIRFRYKFDEDLLNDGVGTVSEVFRGRKESK